MCNFNKYKSWNKSKQSDFNEIPHDQNRGICDFKFRPFNHIDPLVGGSQGNKEWHLGYNYVLKTIYISQRNVYDRLLRPKYAKIFCIKLMPYCLKTHDRDK